ncbi:MAG: PEP-CTERM sorting domain-containing protein [Myxococcota bacterium]
MSFDTASIPDGANLVSAPLDMKILGSGLPGTNTHPASADQLVLVEATLSNPPVARFVDCATIGTVDAPIELAPRIDVGDVHASGDTPIQFVLGGAGLDAIDPTGFSHRGLRGGYDVDDVVVPGVENSLQIYLRSEASPIAGPRLTVAYDAVPEPGFAAGLFAGGLAAFGIARRRAAVRRDRRPSCGA